MSQIKIHRRLFFRFFTCASLLACFLTPARAADTEQKYNDVSYVCTGVGESKDDPRWKEYPLKLMFAGSGRAYVSEVKVSLKDASGKAVLEADCDGPWLLAKLKPGKYSVSASAEGGGTKTASVNVPASGQAETVIRFTSIPQGY